MYWDILVGSLAPNQIETRTKWVRNVWAPTLTEASRIAERMYPKLGRTPTTTIMGWSVYPQPSGKR